MCKSKIKRRIFKPLIIIISIFSVVSFSFIIYMDANLPGNYSVLNGESLKLASNLPVEAIYDGDEESASNLTKSADKGYSVELKAFGIIPIKKASVSIINDTDVLVLGNTFGIKIYTEGVMVVGVDTVTTESGNISPGNKAGLIKGDTIISINSHKVYSNEDVAKVVEDSGGKIINFTINRNGKNLNLKIKPELCYESGKYKTGIWVRDSSAGIGTLTFYSPFNNVICGLGHGVCDVDTGEIIPLNSGELVDAEILSIEKGSAGNPGELVGKFNENKLGDLVLNNDTGVYGKSNIQYDKSKLVKMALKQEVQVGDAKIYTTIDGSKPQYYYCKIEKIAHNNSITKNMIIRITDKKLLEKTGGIVQGMSGSPILQNGKLIGSVTHVFLDDPTGGYAIFAENMLKSAKTASKQSIKKVS